VDLEHFSLNPIINDIMADSEFSFTFFYILSFIVIFILFVIGGLKRGYPLRHILLTITTVSLAGVLGSRLITIPLTEWGNIVSSGYNGLHDNRSAIGGLLFGFAALVFVERYFRFKRPVADLYAWIVPIGLGIQKIGCFMNGCCFGRTSDLPWAVDYPFGTNVHYHHYATGLIQEDSINSLLVHPVQLYESIGLLLIALAVLWSMNTWKRSGSSFIFSFFLFFCFRFLIEFIRDPAASQFVGSYILTIITFKYIMLGMGIAAGILLYLNEAYKLPVLVETRKGCHNLIRDVYLILIISSIIYMFRGLFTAYEFFGIWLRFIPAVLLTVFHVFIMTTLKRYRLAIALAAVLPFFIMSQSFPEDSTDIDKFWRIDFGYTSTKFNNAEWQHSPIESPYLTAGSPGGCGGTPSSGGELAYSQIYATDAINIAHKTGGMGISRVTLTKKHVLTYGLNLQGSNYRITNMDTDLKYDQFLYGFNPYVKWDLKLLGMGIGAHFGKMNLIQNQNPGIISKPEDLVQSFSFRPALYLRMGIPEILDVRFKNSFGFPSPFPSYYGEWSIGSGFGKRLDYGVRYGEYFDFDTKYLSVESRIGKRFGLDLRYIFNERDDFQSFHKASPKLLINMNYRFGFKDNKRK
jgi:phosphatidylglycerol:prolipoprotein diacylglycerol transferase